MHDKNVFDDSTVDVLWHFSAEGHTGSCCAGSDWLVERCLNSRLAVNSQYWLHLLLTEYFINVIPQSPERNQTQQILHLLAVVGPNMFYHKSSKTLF